MYKKQSIINVAYCDTVNTLLESNCLIQQKCGIIHLNDLFTMYNSSVCNMYISYSCSMIETQFVSYMWRERGEEKERDRDSERETQREREKGERDTHT